MPICSGCGSSVGEGVKFCPKCGQPQAAAAYSPGSEREAPPPPPPPPPHASSAGSSAGSGTQDNVMGAVAYITIIPAILFLVLEPYNKNRFIRFHSFQCLFLGLTGFVLSIANMILGFVIGFIPVIGWIISLVLAFAIPIAIFAAWLIAVLKAYQGQEYRLPVIGDLAAKQA
jgi:uncharacterized membrane protein